MTIEIKNSIRYILMAHAAMSLLGIILWLGRVLITGKTTFAFLLCNIGLAWIPLLVAVVVWWRSSRQARLTFGATLLLLVWLFFFPNAPYMVTDMIHLTYIVWYGDAPIWFDVLLVATFVMNGLLLGLTSLYFIHLVLQRYYSAAKAWLSLSALVLIGSFGIYLGRFLRWNTWDVITQPQHIFSDTIALLNNPWHQPRSLAFTLIYFVFILVTYACWYALPRLTSNRPHA